MSTLKSLLTVAAAILVLSAEAQMSGNDAIAAKLDQFISLTNKKQYSEAFDLMYPKLYTKVNKQELVDMMNSMESEGLSLSISNKQITSYSPPLL